MIQFATPEPYEFSDEEVQKYVEALPYSKIPDAVDVEDLLLWLCDEGWTPPPHLKSGEASPSTESDTSTESEDHEEETVRKPKTCCLLNDKVFGMHDTYCVRAKSKNAGKESIFSDMDPEVVENFQKLSTAAENLFTYRQPNPAVQKLIDEAMEKHRAAVQAQLEKFHELFGKGKK